MAIVASWIVALLLEASAVVGQDPSNTKVVEGVPIYNYHEAHGTMQVSPEALHTSRSWIINFPDGSSDMTLHAFCQDPPGHSRCAAQGHPEEQGLDFVEFHGTEMELTELLQGHPDSKPGFIEPDMDVAIFPDIEDSRSTDESDVGLSTVASWGLDRIDDVSGLDGSYNAPPGSKEGAGAHVYIADTGIRTTHVDFGGRAVPAIDCTLGNACKECKGDKTCALDRHGHGTHCAGTVGGKTYGVAKKTTLHAVKVLSDSGSGSMSGILNSIDWVVSKGSKPAVWSASLGGSGRWLSYEVAFQKANKNGVMISVAAGNSGSSACNFSPAFAPSAITVGATDQTDKRAGFSNYGSCLDIFAPGVQIKSASGSSDTGSQTMSGTSMACPHVSGVLALFLADNPGLDLLSVQQHMVHTAGQNLVKDPKSGSPNLMLYVGSNSGGVSTYTTTTATTTTTTPTPLTAASGFCGFESSVEPYCGIWHQNTQDNFDWTQRSGATPSRSTGPNKAYGGSYYIYTEVSSPIQANDVAILEALTPTLRSGAFLSFFYHMEGASDMGSLKVIVRSTRTGITQEVWSKSGNQGSQWKTTTLALESFVGESVVISFVGSKGASGNWQGDIAIDDVMLSIEATTTTDTTTRTSGTTTTTPIETSTAPPISTTSLEDTTSSISTTRTTTAIATSTSHVSTSTLIVSSTSSSLRTTPPETTIVSSTITTTTTTYLTTDKCISAGDTIFLRTLSGMGGIVDIEGSAVRSRWVSRGHWQAISLEKEVGGRIESGDAVFLKTHTGAYIDVSGKLVQARWAERGDWQRLTIQKHGGNGPILPGDLVCFKSHTGKYLDAQNTVLQARWDTCEDKQVMQIEKEVVEAVFSGSAIHILAHTGNRIEVEGVAVQARWAEKGVWQTFTIENYGGRAIFSGDVVFFRAHTGMIVDVQDVVAQARWNDKGAWQTLIIQRKKGDGPILPGDAIFLQTHTGKLLDVEGITVQARWANKGDWETLIIEQTSKRRLSDDTVTTYARVYRVPAKAALLWTMGLSSFVALMLWRSSKCIGCKVQPAGDCVELEFMLQSQC